LKRSLGARPLKEYQAYMVGEDGRISQRIDLSCENDEAARQRASGFADRNTIELWQNDRMIARFPRLS
jgi:hypothetical protein